MTNAVNKKLIGAWRNGSGRLLNDGGAFVRAGGQKRKATGSPFPGIEGGMRPFGFFYLSGGPHADAAAPCLNRKLYKNTPA